VSSSAVERLDPFDGLWRERARRLRWLRSAPGRFEQIRTYYRTHIADFINEWGTTFDPRNVGTGLPVFMPFTLDKRQREWIEFTELNWRDGRYGGTEKSRDVGCSWLAVSFAIALCTLYDNVIVGLGSYKQDKVDRSGDMGSLFEKARAFLDGLPLELRGGYDRRYHSRDCRLLFPNRGKSSMIGEIGDQIGRGGRTAVYFVDEAAYLERDQGVDAALSKNTNCRQDISSVHGMGNTFSLRMHDGFSRKFTFHWRDNPRFTQKMYEEFLEQWGPVITAQELDINYLASQEGILIPAEWVQSAVGALSKLGLAASGEHRAALDVADEGLDRNAFAGRYGQELQHLKSWSGKSRDIFSTVQECFLLCDTLGYASFHYDADGLGAGVRGDSRVINEQRREHGQSWVDDHAYRGSAPPSDPDGEMVPGRTNRDHFANLKSQSWMALRKRFEHTHRALNEPGFKFDTDELISIAEDLPELAQLTQELSQPTYSINGAGKVLIEKAPAGFKSPNLADAVCIAFAPCSDSSFFPESALLARR
jgi:phage terminase large subunit